MGGALTAGLGSTLFGQGKDPVSKFLGIGQQGDYYQPTSLQGTVGRDYEKALSQAKSELGGMRDPNLQRSIADYSTGGMSLDDLFQQAGGHDAAQARLAEIATSPLASGRMAQEMVGRGPLTGRFFGEEDSLTSRALGRLEDAEGGLYDYQPEEAVEYGQVAGDIARRSGQQEQALAQALAQRGLGAAPSGVGQAAFTGALGSKYEQLGRAQADLRQRTLQQRMQNLQSLRNMSLGLAAEQRGAIGQQLDTQFRGRQAQEDARRQRTGELAQGAQMEMGRLSAEQAAQRQSMLDAAKAKSPTLGEAFGRGLTSSFEAFGLMPGEFGMSAAGTLGGNMGGPSKLSPTTAPKPAGTSGTYHGGTYRPTSPQNVAGSNEPIYKG